MSLDELLRYVHRTNPELTKEKLMKELGKCHYSSIALVMTLRNIEKQAR